MVYGAAVGFSAATIAGWWNETRRSPDVARRHWPRFTLRTLFVVVTATALLAAWAAYELRDTYFILR